MWRVIVIVGWPGDVASQRCRWCTLVWSCAMGGVRLMVMRGAVAVGDQYFTLPRLFHMECMEWGVDSMEWGWTPWNEGWIPWNGGWIPYFFHGMADGFHGMGDGFHAFLRWNEGWTPYFFHGMGDGFHIFFYLFHKSRLRSIWDEFI